MAAPSLRARATPAWRARSTLATSALNSRRRLAGLGLIRPEMRWRVRMPNGGSGPRGARPRFIRVEQQTDLHSKLARQLEQTAAEFDGVMGLAVKDLTTGESFAVNAAMVFPQASSIKITVLMELLRQAQAGKLKLDDRVAIKQVQMVGGSGVLQFFGDASSAISLRDLAVLMIVLSDNTATNILIDQVGMANVNDTLAHLGLAP